MYRAVLLTVLFALAVPTVGSADAPAGAQQFATQAQQIIAAATVTYKGDDWGPVPLYTVDLRPALNATIDVADYTADAARNDPGVLSIVETELWQNAGSPPAPGQSTPPPSQGVTLTAADSPYAAQAQALVASAAVADLGMNWDNTPLYMLTIPSLSMTIQVADASAAAANSDSGAIALVAIQLWQNAGSPAAPDNNSAPQTQTTTTTSAPSQTQNVAAALTPLIAIPAIVPAAAPVAPASTSGTPDPMTYAPSIQITISAPAAKQPTVATELTKVLGMKTTLSSAVRLTKSNKKITLAKVKSLLAKGTSVKITLHKVGSKYVVTGIAL